MFFSPNVFNPDEILFPSCFSTASCTQGVQNSHYALDHYGLDETEKMFPNWIHYRRSSVSRTDLHAWRPEEHFFLWTHWMHVKRCQRKARRKLDLLTQVKIVNQPALRSHFYSLIKHTYASWQQMFNITHESGGKWCCGCGEVIVVTVFSRSNLAKVRLIV